MLVCMYVCVWGGGGGVCARARFFYVLSKNFEVGGSAMEVSEPDQIKLFQILKKQYDDEIAVAPSMSKEQQLVLFEKLKEVIIWG